ncbi:MAG TPA: endo-1,4-beta-xylanase [Terriglobales bacterium]|nr:endo-1,4-beta-xylanase [Terriglobales bacterium]
MPSVMICSLVTVVAAGIVGYARLPPASARAGNCEAVEQREPLRGKADRAGILIGTAVRPGQLSEAAYAATLAREYNLVEPEDALKWEVLHPRRDLFDFSDADRILSFARLHGIKVRGHTLVWTHQNPPWLVNNRFSEAELLSILHEHISKVMEHYRGRIFAWDVVNEAVDETGNLRSSLWYDQPGIGLAQKGTAYIEQALRWAREADPDALLFYNDGGGEVVNRKSDAVYSMLIDFRRRNIPIDGVGLQMHLGLDADVTSIARNIQRFSDAGFQVHITEADVAVAVDHNRRILDPGDLDRQSRIYEAVLSACLSQRRCTVFQTWGFTDKYSWINSTSRGIKGAALFFDAQYRPKPAYTAAQRVLSRAVNCR